MSVGLVKAGFRATAAIDNDDDCLSSYKSIVGFKPTKADLGVSKLKDLLPRIPTLVHMSCPCQPFSRMQRATDDDRVELFKTLLSQSLEAFPTSWITVENVPEISDNPVMNEAVERVLAARRHYFDEGLLKTFVLDARDFGVPQTRRRLVWIIPPKGVPIPRAPKGIPPRTLSFRTAIGKIEDHDPEHWPLNQKERACIHESRNTWDECPRTIIASTRMHLKSIGRYVHPDIDRRLTVGECMAIQSLPPIKLMGNVKSRYRQVGNAVPPPMAEAVGRTILAAQERT
jgi:DNA (cytosine-5)-methyltransferase 1